MEASGLTDTVNSIGDVIDNVPDLTINQVTTGIAAYLPAKFFIYMTYFIIAAAIIGITYIFIKVYIVTYKVRVRVKVYSGAFRKAGETVIGIEGSLVEEFTDRAKITTDEQGKAKLTFLSKKSNGVKITCPAPTLPYRLKKGKYDLYEFVMDAHGYIHPINYEGMTITAHIDPNISSWHRQENALLIKKTEKKDALSKWGPTIISIALLVICFLTLYFLFMTTKEMYLGGLANLRGGLGEMAQAFNAVATNCLGSG